LVCALLVSTAVGWGPAGHDTVASIAQVLLTDDAASQANDILNGDSLVDVANWADSVKYSSGYEWSAVLHYIDTPDWACTYKHSRDCVADRCVAGAIANYTYRLGDDDLSDKQITEALKFLVHFVGDTHQPLHVGFTSDEGGNTIKGTFEGDKYNLHAIWDSAMIEKHINDDFDGDQDEYMSYLQQALNTTYKNKIASWMKCSNGNASCPDEWASETVLYACSNAYVDQDGNDIESGFSLGDDYYNFNIDLIDEQLAKAGVRLANVLNNVLDSSVRSKKPAAEMPTGVEVA